MMMFGKWLLPFAVVLVTFLTIGCGDDEENGVEPTGTEEASASPEVLGPVELVQQVLDARVNTGDIDAIMELYTDDVVFYSIECVSGPCIGKEAVRNAEEFYILENSDIRIIESEVSGDTATVAIEVRSDGVQAAGLERFLASITVVARDGKLAEILPFPDTIQDLVKDPETAEWYAFQAAESLRFEVTPGRDADQTPGVAFMWPWHGEPERTQVMIGIEPGPEGLSQPVHIHEGSCADLGAVAFPLQDIRGGKSINLVDVPMDELRSGNFAINVHQSEDEIGVYVACADIPPLEASGD